MPLNPIKLPCPCCGAQQANLSLHLWRLDSEDDSTFTCNECEAEFGLSSVRDIIARWTPFLAWLETAPGTHK